MFSLGFKLLFWDLKNFENLKTLNQILCATQQIFIRFLKTLFPPSKDTVFALLILKKELLGEVKILIC